MTQAAKKKGGVPVDPAVIEEARRINADPERYRPVMHRFAAALVALADAQNPVLPVSPLAVDVLKAYGWECGDEFERRYLTDAWVFNLVNIIERLAAERQRVLEWATTDNSDLLSSTESAKAYTAARWSVRNLLEGQQ